jgi:hypothetical protein
LSKALFDVVKPDSLLTAARDGGGALASAQGQCAVDRFAGSLARASAAKPVTPFKTL